jgi:hydroxymethylbilane synthase
MPQKIIRIATRKSPLALWQANHVRGMIVKHWPAVKIELVPLVTSGDKFLNNKLDNQGGKGLFVKELEEALLAKQADIAVHSMKDVPAEFPKGLHLATICERHTPLDALLSKNFANLADLPQGAVVGTASLRRQSQLLAIRPDLSIKALRGNIQTRIAKMAAGEYDAIILAAAGLERMNIKENVKEIFTTEMMLPACGQGALGIECRVDDHDIERYIAPLHDDSTALCVQTERRVNALLGGNCHVPLAVYCSITPTNHLLLRAKIASADGKIVMSNRQEGPCEETLSLAQRCADDLLANGAHDLLNPPSS